MPGFSSATPSQTLLFGLLGELPATRAAVGDLTTLLVAANEIPYLTIGAIGTSPNVSDFYLGGRSEGIKETHPATKDDFVFQTVHTRAADLSKQISADHAARVIAMLNAPTSQVWQFAKVMTNIVITRDAAGAITNASIAALEDTTAILVQAEKSGAVRDSVDASGGGNAVGTVTFSWAPSIIEEIDHRA